MNLYIYTKQRPQVWRYQCKISSAVFVMPSCCFTCRCSVSRWPGTGCARYGSAAGSAGGQRMEHGVQPVSTINWTFPKRSLLWGSLPFYDNNGSMSPRGKAIWKAFHLVDLVVHQSEEAALLTFLDLSTTRVIAGNPVILTCLWEQSCILHALTELPAYCNFDPKGIFNAWRTWVCTIPLEVVGSVSGKVGSHKQVGLPIHRLQHWMLGCQLPQSWLSLITVLIFGPYLISKGVVLLVSLLHS